MLVIAVKRLLGTIMNKSLLGMFCSLGLVLAPILSQAELTCQYTEPVAKSFSIDLIPCFKPLRIPFEDRAWFEFVDLNHPESVHINGHYLQGYSAKAQSMNLLIYKRNSTLGVAGHIIVKVVP